MIGLEPITCWLQISCSANWATSACKLSNCYYTPNVWSESSHRKSHFFTYGIVCFPLREVTPRGFEPLLPPWKGGVLTTWPWSQSLLFRLHALTPPVGLEPTTLRLTAACSTDWAKEDHEGCTFKTAHMLTFYDESLWPRVASISSHLATSPLSAFCFVSPAFTAGSTKAVISWLAPLVIRCLLLRKCSGQSLYIPPWASSLWSVHFLSVPLSCFLVKPSTD